MKNDYWFLGESKMLSDKLTAHHDGWGQVGSNLMAENWMRNNIAYYSTMLEARDWQSSLGFVGDQGELVKMVVPQARSFIRQIVTLTTKQRLYFRTIAENLNSDVLQATRIGNALCEQVVLDQQLDRKREYNVEGACVTGMSFYKVSWRSDKGTPYVGTLENSVDENGDEFATPMVHYDGDLEISTPSVYDVYWDSRIIDWQDLNWIEVRTVKNRWDMIASFPDIAQEIRAIARIDEAGLQGASGQAAENEDLIYVYEAYHKPTPALPKGRMLVYSDGNTIYYDGPNRYECLPVVPLIPEKIQRMGFGYAKINDLLPAQEMFDMCLSAIATNNSATGVQNYLCPREANISVDQVNGANWIYYTETAGPSGGAPKALQLTQSAPETFKFAGEMKQNMMELSGINSAVRGAPPAGVTSGTAIATLTANSLEFMNSLSKADQIALEQVMWLSIMCYSKFASVPRIVSLTGRGNQMFAKEFVGADIQSIKKVRIITSNPLMNTIGGRADVAEKMLQAGLIKTPQAYFEVLEGAPPEILFQTELSQEDLIHRENEALLDGRPVLTIKTDDHAAHIRAHAALLNDPEVRNANPSVQKILAHMDEHEALARNMDPMLAAMVATGKMPQGLPPGAGVPPGPGGPPMPPPPGLPPAGGPPPGHPMPPQGPPPGAPPHPMHGEPLPSEPQGPNTRVARPTQDPLERMR